MVKQLELNFTDADPLEVCLNLEEWAAGINEWADDINHDLSTVEDLLWQLVKETEKQKLQIIELQNTLRSQG